MKKISIFMLFVAFAFSSVYAESLSVKVTESTPIYKRSLVQVPHTEYIEQQVQVPYRCNVRQADKNSIGLDTIIGTVAGVVIGNQIGRGNGRTAAKIVGGIGGGYIANNMRENTSDTCYRMEFRSIPKTTYSEEVQDRLIGYKNCGYVGNRKICKRTKSKQSYIYLHY